MLNENVSWRFGVDEVETCPCIAVFVLEWIATCFEPRSAVAHLCHFCGLKKLAYWASGKPRSSFLSASFYDGSLSRTGETESRGKKCERRNESGGGGRWKIQMVKGMGRSARKKRLEGEVNLLKAVLEQSNKWNVGVAAAPSERIDRGGSSGTALTD